MTAPYVVKQSDVKAGDILEADAGFSDLKSGQRVKVFADDVSLLYVKSNNSGKYYLSKQDDGRGHYIGFKKVQVTP